MTELVQNPGWIDLLGKLGGCAFRAEPRTLRATFASDGAALLSGFPVERWLADPPLLPELIHPDDRDATLAELRAAATGGERVVEHRLITADGRTLFCRTAVRGRGDGEELWALTIDTTGERLAEERRRESDARLVSLVENVPFDVWACSADGRYVMQNATSKVSWGDLIGRGLEDADLDPTTRARWIENNRKALAGTVVRGEVSHTRAGKISTYFNIIAPIRDGERIRGLLGINIDVTDLRETERERDRLFIREQRARALAEIVEKRNAQLVDELSLSLEDLQQAQAALVKRERLAALGELASVVAHEVRNPLGAIFNSLGALRRMVTLEGEAALLFEILEEESTRLNRLVVDLLNWVRPLQPTLQPQPLASIVEGALRAAERSVHPGNSPAEVSLAISPTLPAVLADDQLLHLALVNVMSNSLHAMPRGGTLTVQVGAVARGDQTWPAITITDTGTGIPPAVVSRIFEPFFTTRASGTGLGLAVVKRIVESHGGEVEVHSQPDRGATFTIRLRFAPEGGPDSSTSSRSP